MPPTSNEHGSAAEAIGPLAYESKVLPTAVAPRAIQAAAPACPTCGSPMVAGYVLGSGSRLRSVERTSALGLLRWVSGTTIGRVGYRAELAGHRCERCRVIVARY